MNSNTSIIMSWILIILLSTMSAMAIQPHLIDDEFTVVDDDFGNTATFQYRIEIEPAYSMTEPIYYKSANEVIELSKKDEYNQSMFWIESYEEKRVWILLKNGSGHLKAYVNDIENLKTSYIRIDDFNSNKTWNIVNNKSIFVDYYSIKSSTLTTFN